MGGSYKRCTGCGGRALSIATRCPGCGGEFPPAEEPVRGGRRPFAGSRRRSKAILLLAGAAILLASLVSRPGQPGEQRSSFGAAVNAAAPIEVGSTNPASDAADTAAAAVVAPRSSARDTAPASAAPDAAPTELRVARRTIHVSRARGRGAPLEAVLEAGDTLSVDSLARGWYRVTFEGAVMGYAESAGVDTWSVAAVNGR